MQKHFLEKKTQFADAEEMKTNREIRMDGWIEREKARVSEQRNNSRSVKEPAQLIHIGTLGDFLSSFHPIVRRLYCVQLLILKPLWPRAQESSSVKNSFQFKRVPRWKPNRHCRKSVSTDINFQYYKIIKIKLTYVVTIVLFLAITMFECHDNCLSTSKIYLFIIY